MKTYILRDVYSGRIFRVYAQSERDAKWKVSQLKGINSYNLAHVRPQERKEYA